MVMVDSVYYSVDETSSGPRLLRDVGRLQVALQRATTACCGGKTTAQCHILGELFRAGPLGVLDLAHRLGVDKAWASRTTLALEREGLLSRSREESDGRAVRLALTKAGRARWRSIDGILNRRALAVLDRIPQAERSAVAAALAALRDALVAELRGDQTRGRKGSRAGAGGGDSKASGVSWAHDGNALRRRSS